MPEPTPRRLTRHEAQEVTSLIKMWARKAADDVDQLMRWVRAASEGEAHIALGYRSWPEYLIETIEGVVQVPDRGQRRELATWLTQQGMSTRAVAPILGISEGTVRNDLRAGAQDCAPAVIDADADDLDAVAPDAPPPAPPNLRVIHGRDGKTYRPPARRDVVDPRPAKRPVVQLDTAREEPTVADNVCVGLAGTAMLVRDATARLGRLADGFDPASPEQAQLRGALGVDLGMLISAFDELSPRRQQDDSAAAAGVPC